MTYVSSVTVDGAACTSGLMIIVCGHYLLPKNLNI